MQTKVNLQTAEHYKWGDGCDGWHFLQSPTLAVIRERMPAGSSEKPHYHLQAQQLFFILSGSATFEIEDKIIIASGGEAVHISPHTKHRILNNSKDDLHFLVISEPKSHDDRFDI